MNLPLVASTEKAVHIEYRDLSQQLGIQKAAFLRSDFLYAGLSADGEFVHVSLSESDDFFLSMTGHEGAMPVASVDGVTVTDNEHLYDLIIGIMG